MLKMLFVVGIIGACVSGCSPRMGQAYSTLPNTFDDLSAKTAAQRGARAPGEATPANQTSPVATSTD